MKKVFWILLISVIVSSGCGSRKAADEQASNISTEDVKWKQEICPTTQEVMKEKMILQQSPLLDCANPEQENLADLLQKQASGMMVQIFAEGLIGSGVIYQSSDDKLYIATAGHVLKQTTDTVWITFIDGFSIESTEYEIMEQEELAFVVLPLDRIPKESLKQYYRVNAHKESFDSIREKDRVIAIGSKSGVAQEAYEGSLEETWVYVETFSQYMMLAKVELCQGMSGGGLFDRQGYFLGILCGENEEGKVAVLPLSVLQAAFDLFIDNS